MQESIEVKYKHTGPAVVAVHEYARTYAPWKANRRWKVLLIVGVVVGELFLGGLVFSIFAGGVRELVADPAARFSAGFLCVVGALFALLKWRATRKEQARILRKTIKKFNRDPVTVRLSLTPHYIEGTEPSSHSRQGWRGVHHIAETPDFFMMFVGETAYCIPRDAFPDEIAYREFVDRAQTFKDQAATFDIEGTLPPTHARVSYTNSERDLRALRKFSRDANQTSTTPAKKKSRARAIGGIGFLMGLVLLVAVVGFALSSENDANQAEQGEAWAFAGFAIFGIVVAVGIVLIGGVLDTARKPMKQKHQSLMAKEQTVILTSEACIHVVEQRMVSRAWDQFDRVGHDENYAFFAIGDIEGFVVPKSAFASEDEFQEFAMFGTVAWTSQVPSSDADEYCAPAQQPRNAPTDDIKQIDSIEP